MRFFSSVLLASCVALSTATPIHPNRALVIPNYNTLDTYCTKAGPLAYVGVQYANGVITSYNYGQCYPYTVNGSSALAAVYCESVLCKNCADDRCLDPNFEYVVLRSSVLVNPGGILTAVLGNGTICNPLPQITLPSFPELIIPTLPSISLPTFPPISLPSLPTISFPALPTLSFASLPTIIIPSITLQAPSVVTLPSLTFPSITLPTLSLHSTTLSLPSSLLPSLTLPSFTLPSITLGALTLH